MHSDIAQILYPASGDEVKYYVFRVTVERFEQDNDGVTAYPSDGSHDTFDVLVGADGQGSRIHRAILPQDAPDPYPRLGYIPPSSPSPETSMATLLGRAPRLKVA